MAYSHLTLDLSAVETLAQFHDALQATFGFPDSYEKNTRGLIDHLFRLRSAKENKSGFALKQMGDILVLEVIALSGRQKSIIRDLLSAVETVNYRYHRRGLPSLIFLDLVELNLIKSK